MSFIPTLRIVSSSPDRPAGGNIIITEFTDTHTRTKLFPDGHAEVEFRDLDTGNINIKRLSRKDPHTHDVRETVRELGYMSAGRILRK